MNYRLLLLDIDGTLRPYDRMVIPEENVAAIAAVQRIGVKVAIATGRGREGVQEEMMNGLTPDYWMCSAGARILDAQNRELFSCRMPLDMVQKAHDFCEANNYPLFTNCSDGSYIHVGYEAYLARRDEAPMMKAATYDPTDEHFRQDPPFACFAWMPKEAEMRFHEQYPDSNMKFYFYRGKYCDIVQGGVNKSSGMRELLRLTGLTREEAVFIGDGENDVELLRSAGLGLCVADGQPGALAAATRLCPPASECGVAAACRELWPEAFT